MPEDEVQKLPIAVAIGQQGREGGVPQIVATGKGFWAEQILQLAFANGVQVREDADLVQMLTAIEIDAPIPVEAFAAVAEILAYVYQANAMYQQRSPKDQE